MAGVGSACLAVGLLTAVYAIGAAIYGARGGGPRWVTSARHAMYALAGLLVTAFVILEAAYLRSDFRFELVATNSSTDTPTFYKFTAIWSSQAGSLLLWVLLLSIFSSAVLRATRKQQREVVPYATAVLGVIASFFLILTVFYASPFDPLANPPAEGNGLNPLLRHPAMMFHPPMLYTGYVGFSVPFAFAVGALITRRTGADWIRATRRFALIAWTFLGFGIMLGSLWSFAELGWGGYWGWDAVENASLMPWLVGTAYLHSIQVEEKRGMLRVWNVSLVMASFVLALLGTFLVRSGILDSIHAFGASTLGKPFLAFIAILAVGSVALVVSRLDDLRSTGRLDSLLSREVVFLLNNLLLVVLCFVIFWGTFFPLISEAVTGTKASVGPPWFDRYTTPLALGLVLLSGVGPALAWGRVRPAALGRRLAAPLAGAALVFGACVAADLARRPMATALFCCAAFAIVCVAQELIHGTRARRALTREPAAVALVALVTRNRRRYGGYTVHLGIVLLLVGVAASTTFQHVRDVSLRPGQSARVGGYHVRYLRPTSGLTAEKVTLGAVLEVTKQGKHVSTLIPSRGYYPSLDQASFGRIGRFFNGASTSELGLRASLPRDIWPAAQPDLSSVEPMIEDANRRFSNASPQLEGFLVAAIVNRYTRASARVDFRLIVSPLVAWIWIGGVIVVGGAMFALWPAPRRARGRARAPAAAPPRARRRARVAA